MQAREIKQIYFNLLHQTYLTKIIIKTFAFIHAMNYSSQRITYEKFSYECNALLKRNMKI